MAFFLNYLPGGYVSGALALVRYYSMEFRVFVRSYPVQTQEVRAPHSASCIKDSGIFTFRMVVSFFATHDSLTFSSVEVYPIGRISLMLFECRIMENPLKLGQNSNTRMGHYRLNIDD